MGGNALKNVKTRRFQRSEYFEIAKEVQEKLSSLLSTEVRVVESYKTKADFGDLDVLVKTPIDVQLSTGFFEQNFDSKQVVHNGPVWSFEFKEFQVDAILNPKESFDFASWYFAQNDQGNLVGRLFHSIGLSHGHDGLWLFLRNEHTIVEKISVTRDYQKAIDFIGLDFNQLREGFETLEDLFSWVTKSKFFNPDIYLLHNRNHVSRIRDEKRPTYTKFLKWIEETKPTTNFVADRENKDQYRRFVFDFFQGVEDEYNAGLKRLERKQAIAAKFNGNIVSELTGLKGKELGLLMVQLKKELTEEFVEFASLEEIRTRIKNAL